MFKTQQASNMVSAASMHDACQGWNAPQQLCDLMGLCCMQHFPILPTGTTDQHTLWGTCKPHPGVDHWPLACCLLAPCRAPDQCQLTRPVVTKPKLKQPSLALNQGVTVDNITLRGNSNHQHHTQLQPDTVPMAVGHQQHCTCNNTKKCPMSNSLQMAPYSRVYMQHCVHSPQNWLPQLTITQSVPNPIPRGQQLQQGLQKQLNHSGTHSSYP